MWGATEDGVCSDMLNSQPSASGAGEGEERVYAGERATDPADGGPARGTRPCPRDRRYLDVQATLASAWQLRRQ